VGLRDSDDKRERLAAARELGEGASNLVQHAIASQLLFELVGAEVTRKRSHVR
jgi:hypothetical protein